jgi:hypothetical protein
MILNPVPVLREMAFDSQVAGHDNIDSDSGWKASFDKE